MAKILNNFVYHLLQNDFCQQNRVNEMLFAFPVHFPYIFICIVVKSCLGNSTDILISMVFCTGYDVKCIFHSNHSHHSKTLDIEQLLSATLTDCLKAGMV